MLTYKEAAARLPATEEKAVLTALKVLHSYGHNYTKRFANNVEIEFRIPERIWEDVFADILSLRGISESEAGATLIADAIREVFRKHLLQVPSVTSIESRQPVGPTVGGLNPGAFGRMTSFKQLTNLWQRPAPPTAATPPAPVLTAPAAKRLIEAVAKPAGLAAHKKRGSLPTCPLGRFVIWSTFDVKTRGDDPFAPRSGKVSELMAQLGLDSLILFDRHPRDIKNPSLPPCFCVLLRYKLPRSMDVHVPTVVEAYAGPGRMNYYFQVWQGDISLTGDLVPRTLSDPYEGHPGHPELVHPVVWGDSLAAPVEIAVVE